MGFLTEFFNEALKEQEIAATATNVQVVNSFDELTEEELETHLRVDKYGDFLLTDAIRPSYDLKVVPQAGYRHEMYQDPETNAKVPVLMAAASREKLFEVFIDLLEPLGHVVDVVLESSHDRSAPTGDEMYREHIDIPVLKSVLFDYEDLLMNDGCSGLAILNPNKPSEVQFDEHKLLIIYGSSLDEYESILKAHGIHRNDELKFITEAEHVHSSCDGYASLFHDLKTDLGIDSGFVAEN